MILPGTRKVKLADIVVEKGFSQRKKTAHHESRKASIKRHGLINLIVIQDRTRKLLAGGDRLAALLALKVKSHEVRVFRGTEEEFEALQLAENIERRHNDDVDAMTKRYVELTASEIEKAEAAEPTPEVREAILAAVDNARKFGGTPDVIVHDGVEYRTDAVDESEAPRPVGRPKTSKGKAREAVAAATGKTPEAIRQAEKRARKKEEEVTERDQSPFTDPGEPLAPPVETYGLPLLSAEEAYFVVVAQEALKKLDVALTKAQVALSHQTDAAEESLATVICRDISTRLYELATDVRAAYPRAVCPSCKRVSARTAKCEVCSGTGIVGVTKWLNAPDELRLGGDKAMVYDATAKRYVPYAREVAKEEKAAVTSKPAKGARRLTVEMDSGEVMHGVREGD